MKRKELLEQVIDIVCRQRQDMHGKPENSLANIAGFWSVYLDKEIKPHDVAAMMVLFKMARAKGNPANDENWMDAAGYAACGSEVAEAAKEQDVKGPPRCDATLQKGYGNFVQCDLAAGHKGFHEYRDSHESPDKCRVTRSDPCHMIFSGGDDKGNKGRTWCGMEESSDYLVTTLKEHTTCQNCLDCMEMNYKPYYRVKPLKDDQAASSKYGSFFVPSGEHSQLRYDAMEVLKAFDRWVEEDWIAVKPLRGPQDLPDDHFLYTLLSFGINQVAILFNLYREWKGLPVCAS